MATSNPQIALKPTDAGWLVTFDQSNVFWKQAGETYLIDSAAPFRKISDDLKRRFPNAEITLFCACGCEIGADESPCRMEFPGYCLAELRAEAVL